MANNYWWLYIQLQLILVTVVIFFNRECKGQLCTMGFPTFMSQCSTCTTTGNQPVTRVIPEMRFTCTGTIVMWRAGGFFSVSGNTCPELGIWRERSSESETYDKVATIELGTCGSGDQATDLGGNIYECTLPESLRVSVQPGDIVGIETDSISNLRFGLRFESGPTNYVFEGQFTTVTLSQSDSTSQDQPRISLTVEMAAQTTEASTTIQLPTTTIPLTTELTTVADTTQGGGEVPTTTVAMESTTTVETKVTSAATTSSVATANVPTTSKVIPPVFIESTTTVENTATQATTTMEFQPTTESSASTAEVLSINDSEPITTDDILITDPPVKPMTTSQSATEQVTSYRIGVIIGAVVGGVVGLVLL